MTAKQPLFLRIFKDGKLLDVKQFTTEQIVIGREGNVDVLINDESISPIHAMVEERNGAFYICDLGSATGTFVKEERVIDHVLESGTEFRLGNLILEFYVGIPRPKKLGEATSVTQVTNPTITNTSIPVAPGTVAPVAATPAPEPTPTPAPAPVEPVAPQVVAPKPIIPVAPPKVEKIIPVQEVVPAKHLPRDIPKQPIGLAKPFSFGVPVGAAVDGLATNSEVGNRPRPEGTFAPPSRGKIEEIVRPGKGNVVEVLLVWQDRVLATRHFDKSKVVQIGSRPDNDIVLPVFGSIRVSHPLVKIEGVTATIFLSQDMTGDVIKDNLVVTFDELRRKGSLMTAGTGYAYVLQQNEAVKVSMGEGVSVVIRYVGNAPESRLLPFIDLSVNHLTGIIFGLMATAVFLFYAYLYAPPLPDKADEEPEPPRKAQFFYKKPPRTEVAVDLSAQEQPKNAPVTEKTKEKPAPSRGEEGGSQEPKHTETQNKVAKKKAVSKNTANANPAAAPKAPPVKDVSKMGLMGAFATKGMQEQLNKAYQGSGNVSGLSKSATGNAADGEGAGVGGSALRDTGANGNGTATVGIAGIKTKGRGGGASGYGTGSLGAKKNASLVAGDSEATFTGSIDREAIRRVVQENLKQIKACYEKGLNRNPGLYGKIVIQWTIGPGGRVTAAGIKTSTMDSSEVENCAVSRLRLWKFPEPPAGEEAVVSYPFVFQAQE